MGAIQDKPLHPSAMFKYRCPAGSGIQVPVVGRILLFRCLMNTMHSTPFCAEICSVKSYPNRTLERDSLKVACSGRSLIFRRFLRFLVQNRLVTAPVKLSNWRVSWQELLCYNPRPYNITEAFMENCKVVRGMMETYVQKITDIVFVVSDPCLISL